jgi:hypothetical protein
MTQRLKQIQVLSLFLIGLSEVLHGFHQHHPTTTTTTTTTTTKITTAAAAETAITLLIIFLACVYSEIQYRLP